MYLHKDYCAREDRKSTRLNSSHTVIYTLSLHDALPIYQFQNTATLGKKTQKQKTRKKIARKNVSAQRLLRTRRSEEHTSELQSHSDLHSFPTRRSSDLSVSEYSDIREKNTEAENA